MIEVIQKDSPYARKEKQHIVKVTDKNNKTFTMQVGGNLDMYWMPEDDEPNDDVLGITSFEFNKGDDFFDFLEDAFSKIKKKDNKYSPTLVDDLFTFVSEDSVAEDEANILQIKKSDDKFTVYFIKQEDSSFFSMLKRGYSICFCNSGSRHPDIEQIFKRKFLEIAYGYQISERGE